MLRPAFTYPESRSNALPKLTVALHHHMMRTRRFQIETRRERATTRFQLLIQRLVANLKKLDRQVGGAEVEIPCLYRDNAAK